MSNLALTTWRTLSSRPGGKWLFSRMISWKTPYFASIKPAFLELRPGYCEVRMKKRRAVTNHIATVHAIAMCNLAEVAAGLMTEVSIPGTHRWIPKGMTVEYLKKAETNLHSIAKLDPIPQFTEAQELPITVNVIDENEETVFRAVISMWVSPRD
jgi:acyl-coenzyme A thioesterase PaaI-like protein